MRNNQLIMILCQHKKSQRNETLLTVDFNLRKQSYKAFSKSRRDDTVLTVGFNLRKQKSDTHTLAPAQSRRDDT
jgi:hypothetical protein